jgi:L-rhamnose 1-dehydrogenase
MATLLLDKKVVVITGSSRGIGRAVAVASAQHGATGLLLHYYGDAATEAEVQQLKQEIELTYPHARAVTVPGDIGDAQTSTKVCCCSVPRKGAYMHRSFFDYFNLS